MFVFLYCRAWCFGCVSTHYKGLDFCSYYGDSIDMRLASASGIIIEIPGVSVQVGQEKKIPCHLLMDESHIEMNIVSR